MAGLEDLTERTGARQVWEVAALVRAVADTLAQRFAVVSVRGEIGGFTRAASGHCYFTLKDAEGAASLRCAMFRRAAALMASPPQEGDAVELRGRLAVYEPRGELQFIVESLQRAGAGALYERFLRLKAELEAEGLFDAARKRPLPGYPRRVGIVTSLGAAVLRDVATALARRAPQVELLVYPSPVQGADAPAQLAAAIALASRRAEVDTLLVCRGGGSLEDLWAFNEAVVVRAIAACSVPVISGVGHETDVTLADFAADLRAPTPTAAAELAAPPRDELLADLQSLADGLWRGLHRRLDADAQRLDRAALRLARPGHALAARQARLALLAGRLRAAVARRLTECAERERRLATRWLQAGARGRERQQQRLSLAATRLEGLDPQRVLARGYARLVDAGGAPLSSVSQLSVGAEFAAMLADGRVEASVTAVQPAALPAG
ncbi:exodeoxyribonuclease VII large subunit [Rivibacter subsaxonicus]|uniref:Exodeoxyribonuclease 7 large subunit n=1 Tax=Rivibacter subsaxonicus TaxID=457575 RepID=A0A4Q7VPB6_9BURK|nr:exodeoxyribonuclease VII large subunit [Rivibacter subsaxonicus]RZT97968.1 exodeoxyribonuclease VII large subunit [Rivibacter subsaxonicus]